MAQTLNLRSLRRLLLAAAISVAATPALAGGMVLSDAQLDSVTAGGAVLYLHEGSDLDGRARTYVEMYLEAEGPEQNFDINTKTRTVVRETKRGTVTVVRTRTKGVVTGESTDGYLALDGDGDLVRGTSSFVKRNGPKGSKTVVRGRVVSISYTPRPTT